MIGRLRAGLVVLALFGLAAATVAWGGAGPRERATLKFNRERPAKSTGAKLAIDYRNPDDPNAKPPAVRKVVIKAARGTRIDTSVPGLCTASDAELIALGAAACPDKSRVGGGVVTVDTGFPGPGRIITSDVTLLNNTGQLILLTEDRGTNARLVTRSTIAGRRLKTEAPPLPGTPPDGGAIDTVDLHLKRVTRPGHAYLRTPRRCPARGAWINRLRFTYADGVTEHVRNRSRCIG
jgi:hypothetical protein